MAHKAASASGVTADSLAPAIMATASPRRMVSKASPTAWAPEAQAEVMAKLGPRAPTAIEICPAAMSAIIIGTVKGLTRSGPRSTRTWCASSICCRPPIALATSTPTWSRFSSLITSPDSATASRVATMASWTNRLMRRASLRPRLTSGLKSCTSLATWLGIPFQRIRLIQGDIPEGSKASIRRVPDRPAFICSQVSRVDWPSEVSMPVPVTTTRVPFTIRRSARRPSAGRSRPSRLPLRRRAAGPRSRGGRGRPQRRRRARSGARPSARRSRGRPVRA